ncbi:MAG: alpha/beta hydrolase family esterase, partial [bacterium]
MHRSFIKVSLLLAGIHLLFWTGCDGRTEATQPAGLAPGDHTFQISTGGLQREYVVHVPVQYHDDTPVAVVMMFHGGGGAAQNAMEQTGWDDKAEQEGFLAVFPQGSRPSPSLPASFSNNPQTWNDGSGREALGAVRRNADDVAFVTALLDDLTARFNVDEGRIYAAGFSNGASMVFRVGRTISARIAAIACVAGTDWL